MLRGACDSNFNHAGAWGIALALIFSLAGCATAPKSNDAGPLFYPPLPNPPRIQFLKTFSKRSDLGKSSSALANFIVGSEEKSVDLINKPYGVAMYDGKIYVVDTRGSGYGIFDLVKQEFSFITGSAGGHMKKPINIFITPEGNKFVTDTDRNQVLMFDRGDRFIRAYGKKDQFRPSDVAVLGNRLYVSDVGNHKVHVLDVDTGGVLFEFGGSGVKEGQMLHPTNLAIGPDETVYVSDTSNFRVQQFSKDGIFLRKIGSVGTGFGKFARPKGIAVDQSGRLFVVDAAFENVQIINPNGKLLLFFGKPGAGPGDINLPTKVVVDYRNAPLFQQYAAPGFRLEFVVLVASQFGANKVNVYGFGKMEGIDYPDKSPDDSIN